MFLCKNKHIYASFIFFKKSGHPIRLFFIYSEWLYVGGSSGDVENDGARIG